jgi:hypothetical protein
MGKLRIVLAAFLIAGPVAVWVAQPASARVKQILNLHADLDFRTGTETDGTGDADLDVFKKTRRGRPSTYRACWSVTWANLEQPVRGHVHRVNDNALVLPFFENVAANSGSHTGCQKISKRLSNELGINPGNFYVNLHDADDLDGAIRGFLQPAP